MSPSSTTLRLRRTLQMKWELRARFGFLKNIPGLWLLQECRRAWGREGQEYSYAELMERAAVAKPIRTMIDLDEFLPREPSRAHP